MSTVFQQFQAARTQFAQSVAELAARPECIEQVTFNDLLTTFELDTLTLSSFQLIQENVLYLLQGLLLDMNPTIQQNAALAVGRLAGHSSAVAELVVRADLLRKLISLEMGRPNVKEEIQPHLEFL